MMEITAFAILMGIFAISDIVSTKTEARFPTLFTIAVLSIAGYWTGIIPRDLFTTTGISVAMVYLVYYLQLANMGALISISEMLQQWRTIVIAVAGLLGVIAGALAIGGVLFGREVALIGAPPLAGGIVAYEIMRQGAEAIGRSDLAIMALAVFVIQSFVGYPLTSFLLKKEGRRLLEDFKPGAVGGMNELSMTKVDECTGTSKKGFQIPQIPAKYNSPNVILFKLAITGLVGILITNALNASFRPEGGDFISRYVILLIVGVVFSEIGFLDRSPIAKSNISGYTYIVIVGFAVVSGLASATPEVVFSMIAPTVGIVISGVAGLALFSGIAGKILGYSKEMAISIALSALYGYPGTEILSNEAVKVTAKTPEQHEFLLNRIQPKMIIGGFTTVTFGSVFLAGIIVKML
ncbi:hypothetical protein SAMN02745751_03660 [Dethiosulfatibacter aminovorans DSM 17477]|uniref:Na+/glutamate symporter n=1 Tax=Dethiosulfatibacter aminovorans DSM 17477 TaxID=1121476 RepID=A0A1M6N1T6_9FIRM|nr:hypothetical protein [Dethiosulfatibacter aminovorans]SHJ89618.1 hypothetical protein SAMN02745751_03660 [Dethiosulfatibacter aminovorans DSM 17477]